MKSTACLFILGFALLACGCAAVVAGAAVGVGAVYVTGDDSSAVYFDLPTDTVFDACVAVMEAYGKVEIRNRTNGRIKGQVEDAAVTMQLERPSVSMVRVVVYARRHLAGISPAQEVAKRMAQRVVERIERGKKMEG